MYIMKKHTELQQSWIQEWAIQGMPAANAQKYFNVRW